MRGNNILGILFSNVGDSSIKDLTEKRTFGSVPFGGRYRMIDFPLSNMVNSGINKIAVITNRNYQSLMNHLGSGKSWDLSRRHNGLFLFPPFGNNTGDFHNRVEMIYSISSFIKKSKEEYVLLSDCDVISNINYEKVMNTHEKNNADITLVCTRGHLPKNSNRTMVFSKEYDGRINEIRINPDIKDECCFGLNKTLIKKHLLLDLIHACISSNKKNFDKDVLQKNVLKYRIFSYEYSEFRKIISSVSSYFDANMNLIDSNARSKLFNSKAPIYTKIRDDMPTKYGKEAQVKNSIISDGCHIKGIVENSIISKGVKIGKGSKITNCVIMQDTEVGENCNLNYIITDKDVIIKNNRILMGFKSYPVYISKASIV